MAIRTNTNPHRLELHPELQEILMRNGLRAAVTGGSNGFQLVVQGHDSPLLYYPISEKQLRALVDWGTNTANKRAYNTLASVIATDFDLPRDFVNARNANGRVAMGLHGARIGVGEYGRVEHPFGRGFLGWTPRQQSGYHMRRIGGDVWFPGAGAPMVAVRPDGRQKPGELQAAGYGFYYRGTPQGAVEGTVPQKDVLAEMQAVIQPVAQSTRQTAPATPYKDVITSDVYFSNEKWQQVLASHGILIDADKKTLTVQSSAEEADFVYDLKDEELAKITNNSLTEVALAERIRTINGVIQDDFKDAITLTTLNSKDALAIELHPEVRRELNLKQEAVDQQLTAGVGVEEPEVPLYAGREVIGDDEVPLFAQREGHPDIGAVIDGHELYGLKDNKAWYREGKHGREVDVGQIAVRPGAEGKYTMTAVINGESITHDISQKDYDKFLAVNDFQRMKLFSKIFKEVDMKNIYDTPAGVKIGAGILSALTVGGTVYAATHSRPEFYGGGPAPRPYFKPGVDSPEDVAARNFNAMINNPNHPEPHRGL